MTMFPRIVDYLQIALMLEAFLVQITSKFPKIQIMPAVYESWLYSYVSNIKSRLRKRVRFM